MLFVYTLNGIYSLNIAIYIFQKSRNLKSINKRGMFLRSTSSNVGEYFYGISTFLRLLSRHGHNTKSTMFNFKGQ